MMNNVGFDNFCIILICEYPCKNKEQLVKREREGHDKNEK